MMLRVDDHRGSWQALQPGVPSNPAADLSLPRLSVLGLLSVVSSSISGSTEPPRAPTLSATLLQDAAALVADPPLGARARAYAPNGVLVFDGRVRQVAAARDRVTLDLESEIPT